MSSQILVGTKADEVSKYQVTADTISDFANSNSLSYYAVSSKTGENVNLVFEALAKDCLAKKSSGSGSGAGATVSARAVVHHFADDDELSEEEFSDSDLENDLEAAVEKEVGVDEKMKKNKKKKSRAAGEKSQRHKHDKTNVNVFSLSLKSLEKEPAVMTGDPYICRQCGVMLTGNSPVKKVTKATIDSVLSATHVSVLPAGKKGEKKNKEEKKEREDEKKVEKGKGKAVEETKKVAEESKAHLVGEEYLLVPAPPIHKKFEYQSAVSNLVKAKDAEAEEEEEEEDDDDEEFFVWPCEFCGRVNNLSKMGLACEEELPKSATVDYLVEPAPVRYLMRLLYLVRLHLLLFSSSTLYLCSSSTPHFRCQVYFKHGWPFPL